MAQEGFKFYWNKFKDWIIFAGMGIGVLVIFEVLPKSTDILGLKDNVKFVYLAVILAAGFTFYTFYNAAGQSRPGHQRTVTPRHLSDPRVLADIQRQRGNYPRPHVPVPPASYQAGGRPVPENIWKTFEKEE